MAPRIITVQPQPQEEPAAAPDTERFSQRKRAEARYLLQVDRQTKSSHATREAAEEIGARIKRAYPKVQVSVYDHVECVSKLVEASAAS
jgi:hypothetical protein